jgi:hypothetical protein
MYESNNDIDWLLGNKHAHPELPRENPLTARIQVQPSIPLSSIPFSSIPLSSSPLLSSSPSSQPLEKKKLMAVKILPKIYLGDQKAAANTKFFKKVGIDAVLNMTPNIPNTFRDQDNIEYLRIPVHDSYLKRDVGKMYQYFPVVTEFIYKTSVMEDKNLLIHCALGRMTPLEAMEYIISRKEDSFHWGQSANFAKSLNKWYYKINGNESN